MGDLRLEWFDDEGSKYRRFFEDFICCPQSRLSLIGITKSTKKLRKDLPNNFFQKTR